MAPRSRASRSETLRRETVWEKKAVVRTARHFRVGDIAPGDSPDGNRRVRPQKLISWMKKAVIAARAPLCFGDIIVDSDDSLDEFVDVVTNGQAGGEVIYNADDFLHVGVVAAALRFHACFQVTKDTGGEPAENPRA